MLPSWYGCVIVVLGGLQVVGGLLSGILEIIAFVYGNTVSVGLVGVWVGILYIATGFIGIRAGSQKTERLLKLYKNLGIACIVIAFLMIGYGIGGCITGMAHANNSKTREMRCLMNVGVTTASIFEILLFAVSLGCASQAMRDIELTGSVEIYRSDLHRSDYEPGRNFSFNPRPATYTVRPTTTPHEQRITQQAPPQEEETTRRYSPPTPINPTASAYSDPPPAYSDISNYPTVTSMKKQESTI